MTTLESKSKIVDFNLRFTTTRRGKAFKHKKYCTTCSAFVLSLLFYLKKNQARRRDFSLLLYFTYLLVLYPYRRYTIISSFRTYYYSVLYSRKDSFTVVSHMIVSSVIIHGKYYYLCQLYQLRPWTFNCTQLNEYCVQFRRQAKHQNKKPPSLLFCCC